MVKLITSEIVKAYFHCPLRAFRLLHNNNSHLPHEYMQILANQTQTNQDRLLTQIKAENKWTKLSDIKSLSKGSDLIIDGNLIAGDLEVYCSVLTKIQGRSALGNYSYEPTFIAGTYQISKEQKLELSFIGYVLAQVQNKLPIRGTIVKMGGKPHKVELESSYKTLLPIIEHLRELALVSPLDEPPLILNKHCSYCEFRNECLSKAERVDDLSLLDRITPKAIQKYHKKGIFTVTQLSYLFKPRRRKKKSRSKLPILFKTELQALAIRTGKIYIQELPELTRHQVELFIDIEGIPDQNFHYLIGLMISENGKHSYHYFWADAPENENQIWNEFLEKTKEYPNAPIYHYGSYEPRAIDSMEQKYQTNNRTLKDRLININSHVYGKIYFPIRSNNLKVIGKFIGATWSSPDASGLQSLVWRHKWEDSSNNNYKEILITYNREDCHALWLLTEELTKIINGSNSNSNIDFADRPKQNTSETGSHIHKELENIIRYAHADYQKKHITIRHKEIPQDSEKKKMGGKKGHIGYCRKTPSNVRKIIQVAPKRKCPKHIGESLDKLEKNGEKYLIDLKLTKTGIKRVVTKYIGAIAYCHKCNKEYKPPEILKLNDQLFGHSFQAWTIYQRITLRLPYRIITQEIEELFNERISEATIINFIGYFAQYYGATEKKLIQQLLKSPFIHVDETPISIQGFDHYVWVFTDGQHVVFRITETREADIAHTFLAGYKGVLISDFYGGYDSVGCKQQKCLVHLIRDLNNDLWKAPYDTKFAGTNGIRG